MNREAFKQRLAEGPLLLDGAMGTLLHGRGIPIDECFDALNVSQPAIVADVHRDYIAAGADILETNSFGANRFKLAEHGLEEQVRAINSAAVTVARRAIAGSFRSVLLAGSVGPLGVHVAPLGRVSMAEAVEAYRERAQRPADRVEATVRRAALLAGPLGQPETALVELQALREHRLTADADLRVGVALVDVYERRLADPGRAMVELRRLIDLYPDRRATLRLRRELAILKDERRT